MSCQVSLLFLPFLASNLLTVFLQTIKISISQITVSYKLPLECMIRACRIATDFFCKYCCKAEHSGYYAFLIYSYANLVFIP